MNLANKYSMWSQYLNKPKASATWESAVQNSCGEQFLCFFWFNLKKKKQRRGASFMCPFWKQYVNPLCRLKWFDCSCPAEENRAFQDQPCRSRNPSFAHPVCVCDIMSRSCPNHVSRNTLKFHPPLPSTKWPLFIEVKEQFIWNQIGSGSCFLALIAEREEKIDSLKAHCWQRKTDRHQAWISTAGGGHKTLNDFRTDPHSSTAPN